MQNIKIKSLHKVVFSQAAKFASDTAGAVAVYSAIALLLLLGVLTLSLNMNMTYSDQEKAQQLLRAALTQPAREYPYLWLRRLAQYHKGENSEGLYDTSGYLFCSKCAANPNEEEMTDEQAEAATIKHIQNYLKSKGSGIIEHVDNTSIKPVFKKAADGTVMLYASAKVAMTKNFQVGKEAQTFNVESGKVIIPGDFTITGSPANPFDVIALLDVSRQAQAGAPKAMGDLVSNMGDYLTKIGMKFPADVRSAAIPFSEVVSCPLGGCGAKIDTVKSNGSPGPAPGFGACNGELMAWDGGISNNGARVEVDSFTPGTNVNAVQHRILPFVGQFYAQHARLCPSGKAVWTYKLEEGSNECKNHINPFTCDYPVLKCECVKYDKEGECIKTKCWKEIENGCFPCSPDLKMCIKCDSARWHTEPACYTTTRYSKVTWYPTCSWNDKKFFDAMQDVYPGRQPKVAPSSSDGRIYSSPMNHLKFRAVYMGCSKNTTTPAIDPKSGSPLILDGIVREFEAPLPVESSELTQLQHRNSLQYIPYERPADAKVNEAGNFSGNEGPSLSSRPYGSGRFGGRGGLLGYYNYNGGGGVPSAESFSFFTPASALFNYAGNLASPPSASAKAYSVAFVPSNCIFTGAGGAGASLNGCDIPQGYYRIEVQGVNLQGALNPTDEYPFKNKYNAEGTMVMPGWGGDAATACFPPGTKAPPSVLVNYDYSDVGAPSITCENAKTGECGHFRNKSGYTSGPFESVTVVKNDNGGTSLPPSQVLMSSFSIETGRPAGGISGRLIEPFKDPSEKYPYPSAGAGYESLRTVLLSGSGDYRASGGDPRWKKYFPDEVPVSTGVLNLVVNQNITTNANSSGSAAPLSTGWHQLGIFDAQPTAEVTTPAAPKNNGTAAMMNRPLDSDNTKLSKLTSYLNALSPSYTGEPMASGFGMMLAKRLGDSAGGDNKVLYLLSLTCPAKNCGAAPADTYGDPGTGLNWLVRWSSESNGNSGAKPYTSGTNQWASRLQVSTACPSGGEQYTTKTREIWKYVAKSMAAGGNYVFPIITNNTSDPTCAEDVKALSTDTDPNKFVAQQVGDLRCGEQCAKNAAADLAYQIIDGSGQLAREICEGKSGDQCSELQTVKPVMGTDGSFSWQNM